MNKIKHLGIIKFAILLLLIPFMYQCMHDEFEFDKLDDEMEIVFGFLGPGAYGSLSINDIISELDSTSYFSTDPDGLLMLSYRDTIGSFVAEELLVIPSQNFFEFFIESDFGFPVAPPAMTFPIDRKAKFPFVFNNDEKLDSMRLDAGNLVFDISSSFQHQAQVQLTIPGLTLNGNPFTETFNISDESGSYSESIPFTLDGYTIELQDSVGNDTMFFPVEFHVEIYTNGVNPISTTDEIQIDAHMEDLDFEAIFGYIGKYGLLGETGSIELGFFDNPFDGFIEFTNPQLNINISNSYGVPAEINLERLTGFNADGDSIQMTYDPLSTSTFRYAFPSINEYGQTKDTTITINSQNSNIPEFLAFLPSSIDYNIDAESNPDGNVDYNYVSDQSKIDISLEFVMPLEFKADNFVLTDTMEDVLSDGWYDDADMIEQINI